MRLKKNARPRTIKRYVARHEGFIHDCKKVGCHPAGYFLNKRLHSFFVQVAGCSAWDKKNV